MPLTDAAVRAARPRDGKLSKLSDGDGLQLWAHPSGKRSWHVAFRNGGRQRSVTLGPYPDLSLKQARIAAREARARAKAKSAGEDGAEGSRAPAPLFGAVSAEWLETLGRGDKARSTLDRAERLAGAMRTLDDKPIGAIRPPEILALLRPLETAGHLETARRMRAQISRVFRHAAALGYVDADPAALLRGLVAAPRSTPRAAIVAPDDFAQLMRAIDAWRGRSIGAGGVVRDALMMLALTAARPGELRLAQWSEFDLEAGVWTPPAARMKMRRPHRAPLARQSIDILKRLQGEDGVTRAASPFVFPGQRDRRPLSENTFVAALRAMGYAQADVCAHGFRSSFSTLANESGLWNPDAIERALAHREKGETRRAYHRAEYFEERKRLMQWWADWIDRALVANTLAT